MLISSLTGKYYDEKDCLRIVNVKQACFYWHSGVRPISIYPSTNHKTGEPCLVFIFSKSKTRELYQEWLKTRPESMEEN